jgi:hypothetical protein
VYQEVYRVLGANEGGGDLGYWRLGCSTRSLSLLLARERHDMSASTNGIVKVRGDARRPTHRLRSD